MVLPQKIFYLKMDPIGFHSEDKTLLHLKFENLHFIVLSISYVYLANFLSLIYQNPMKCHRKLLDPC